VTTREERLEGLKQTHQAVVEALKEQIQQKQVQISSLEEKLSIRFLDRILFDPGNAIVTPTGREALKKLAEGLKKASGTMIHVEGHTDNLPLSEAARAVYIDNLGLSMARAAAVVRTLRTMGVDPEVLSVAGYSMHRPLASNDTAEGRQKNRRVEIILTPAR
jgi:chemotaxis protein MotB